MYITLTSSNLNFLFLTNSLEPSGPPTITITEAAADSIYLHWSPPALENQNGIITGYIIDFSSGQNDSRSISVETVSTEYTLVAIPYTNYSLRVAAVNSAGQGPFSSAVNVETLQDGMVFQAYSLV